MVLKYSLALADYLPAFGHDAQPFLFYYSFYNKNEIRCESFTRRDIWSLAAKAALVIRSQGLNAGDCFVLCLSSNRFQDIALRLAATMTATTPVTINWQVDTRDQVLYKIQITESKLVFTDTSFDSRIVAGIKDTLPRVPIIGIDHIEEGKMLPDTDFSPNVNETSTRIIVFTSGTTGNPKGVQLPYRAYQTNRKTFEQFLDVSPAHQFAVLIVNPMHHTNSTAITDWALRRPGSVIHLLERYTTNYWKLLYEVAQRNDDRLVAPVVSRHMDFLEELDQSGNLPIQKEQLMAAMKKTDFLIGSAPVGPTTIKRFLHYADKIPHVRFGSTETCLQVIGIPRYLPNNEKQQLFKTGWSHHFLGEPQPGYYIGRPHPPFTEAKIVKSIDLNQEDFLRGCERGEPGYLITRGHNLMSGYVNNPDETAKAFHGHWYIGLKDICFALLNEKDDALDFFWVSRDSAMLIRGGANYAYDQINAEMANFIHQYYQLPRESFDIAVVGLKVNSEHEDACCVTIELKTGEAKKMKKEIDMTFLNEGKRHLSKGARPDYLQFGSIPRNFKGAVLVKDLINQFSLALYK